MTCQREGCSEPARRRYCSEACRRTDEQRRARARARDAAAKPVVRVHFIGLTIEREEHTVWGVETSEDVAFVFRDDARRFRRS